MGKLLSICIPSFNMEKYLSRNLDSFLKSTMLSELELIIVNDGSTDKTLEIAKDYYSKYPNTIIIIDKPNGHYGSCVNAALKIAKGKYFRIVDADDWVNPVALDELIVTTLKTDTDVIYTRYSNFYESDGSLFLNEDPAKMIWWQPLNLNNLCFKNYVHMHQITYRTQFLKDIEYIQTERVCYTDTEYVYKPIIQAKDIYCLNTSLYQYYIGRDDQSMSSSVLLKNFNHLYTVLLSIINFPRPKFVNNNFVTLYKCYVNALLGMLIDCLFASQCRNKAWNSQLHDICKRLESQNFDLSHYLSYSIRGCCWFKWWLSDTIFSRFKLRLLFTLLRLKN